MQTKNINHQQDPQGLNHQNCQLSNSTASETLSNDRMYGSTNALDQRSDISNMRDQLMGQTNRSTSNSNIPKLLTPLRSAPKCSSFRSQISSTTRNLNLGQTISCTSTPLLSTGILRRQTSLGQLEGRTSTSSGRLQNSRSDGPFGAFQQKIRSMLLPTKDSTKTKETPINANDVSGNERQNSYESEPSESLANIQRIDNNVPQNLVNNYSTIRSVNSQTIEVDNSVDEENDSFYIRDVCSKWFGQKQSTINQSFSSQMVSAVNKSSFSSDSPKLSHNMKSSLSEKVVKKDSICQNSYTNGTNNENNAVNGWTLNQNYSDTRPQNSDDLNSVPHDRHVVVVSSLECDTNRSTALTVRSELTSNEISVDNNSVTSSAYVSAISSSGSQPQTDAHKVSEIHENIGTVSSPDHNYKSSSDSGRGTLRNGIQHCFKNNSSDGVSPLDLTSLDSDQSIHGVSNDTWHNQNTSTEPTIKKGTKNNTIEKMQRELQRILEDNNSGQSIEVEVENLSRSFQTSLSVVNESDSWTSNTPSQTPQPQQKPTSVKYCEPKGESKYSSIGSNGLTTASKQLNSTKSKQNYFPNEIPINLYNKQKIISEKHKYAQQRSSKTSQVSNPCSKRKGNEKSVYASNKSKIRTRVKSKDRFIQPIDCDMISTTTGRDTNYDDLSSEYTANTSLCERDRERDGTFAIRKQLQGLEDMYSEIIGILGSRKKSESNKNRRKVCRSTSSVVSGRSSVTSRGTRDQYYRRNKQEFRHKYDDSHSSRRIKRLESHVITLARSVAQLSTDMRSNHSLSQEMDNLRQDVDLIRNQLLALKQSISSNGFSTSSKAYHQSNGYISANGRRNQNHIISPNKVEKLKRFFGDEPPLLRQFLKKLGYEKYARNFESEKIGITELPYLTEERMQKLGIPLGPRMRIMQESHHHLKTLSHSNNDNYSIYAIV